MFREGRWWLEDLASQNGTLLNGARINVTTALKTGDAIALGTVLVGFAEVGEISGRVKLQPQGVPVASRRMTGEVLMQGMPARKQASTEKFEEVATASGEGGPTVDFGEIDSELTSPRPSSSWAARRIRAPTRSASTSGPRWRRGRATRPPTPICR
jgi:hypothetical protein